MIVLKQKSQFKERVLADGGTFEAGQCAILSESIRFIPREMAVNTLSFVNETTGVETLYNVNYSIDNYYLVVAGIFDLEEDNFYKFTALNGSKVVYKDKVFCTTQDISEYTVNNNTYTSYSSDNDYITYE